MGCDSKRPLDVEDFSVRLVQPLTVRWSGSENGQPFRLGSTATLSARTDHAANWKLTITSQRGTRFLIDHDIFQDRFATSFLADPQRDFFAGDTLTAVVELRPPLHPDDLDKSVVRFVIEGGRVGP